MIAIVNYDRKAAKKLSSFLSDRGIDNIATLDEAEISLSDKIILPHFHDLKSTLKKLQLSNIFSLLKVVKKDILGINSGMLLFCRFIKDAELTGLGVFENAEVCMRNKLRFDSKLQVLKECKLLKGCADEIFHFEFEYYISDNVNAVAQVNFEDKNISAVAAKNNYYAALFSIEDSGSAGEKIIRNFITP
ncbi:MAG: hypothetical protein GXO87_09345 [Chlorobi bacterium]|nr:hypothetical protein [Chlorobiota bacterium]